MDKDGKERKERERWGRKEEVAKGGMELGARWVQARKDRRKVLICGHVRGMRKQGARILGDGKVWRRC